MPFEHLGDRVVVKHPKVYVHLSVNFHVLPKRYREQVPKYYCTAQRLYLGSLGAIRMALLSNIFSFRQRLNWTARSLSGVGFLLSSPALVNQRTPNICN